jgi:hypothetical protein
VRNRYFRKKNNTGQYIITIFYLLFILLIVE